MILTNIPGRQAMKANILVLDVFYKIVSSKDLIQSKKMNILIS